MGAESRIESYYEALREGDPLYPYFAPDTRVVKFGISETLVGYEAIEAGLEEQSRTTRDWRVDSHALRVTERDRHAWFSDTVDLGWTNTERGVRHEFETRWSGTLERRQRTPESRPGSETGTGTGTGTADVGDWRFVGMHVSTAGEL